jgi:structure-specific recognition protein 1
MRFYVPNIDQRIIDEYESTKAVEAKDEEKKSGESEDDQSEDEGRPTPASIFNDAILKKAGLQDATGEIIATLSDINLAVPRGKYSVDLFQEHVRFHGRTHVFKVRYKDIDQLVELPKADRN